MNSIANAKKHKKSNCAVLSVAMVFMQLVSLNCWMVLGFFSLLI